jgi:hypothetical protein
MPPGSAGSAQAGGAARNPHQNRAVSVTGIRCAAPHPPPPPAPLTLLACARARRRCQSAPRLRGRHRTGRKGARCTRVALTWVFVAASQPDGGRGAAGGDLRGVRGANDVQDRARLGGRKRLLRVCRLHKREVRAAAVWRAVLCAARERCAPRVAVPAFVA